MSRKRFSEMNCAIAQALEQIGDWWTLLIVRDASYGASTFTEFQESLGIAKNILADRLAALVEHGIMTREPVRPGVSRYRYLLTPKGLDLVPVLVGLLQWGDRWVYNGTGPLQILDAHTKEPVRPLTVQASDGRPLQLSELKFKAKIPAAPTAGV